jgi:protein ImuA
MESPVRCAPPAPKTAAQLLSDRATDTVGAADSPTLTEIFAENASDGGPLGFLLAQIDPACGPVLWISDRLSRQESGRLCIAGLPRPLEVIAVDVNRPLDVLWAMEQGLGCGVLGAVVGEIWGDPPQLDFTATKRLALRAEAHGVAAWLIRRAAHPNLSAARKRWRVASLAALPDPDDSRAPGAPLWQATLFRSRWGAPGDWVARPTAQGGLHLDHRVEADAALPRAAEH